MEDDLVLPLLEAGQAGASNSAIGVKQLKVLVHHLSRTAADNTKILDDVTIEVPPRSVVGLVGPSGSGKSTVLRAINRLWEPPGGAVFLDSKDVATLPVVDVRQRVGMVFQQATLFEGTVADNVRYGPALQGRKLSSVEVEELLGLANLDASYADKDVASLSGGQAQRVSLARTLANRPEVLLLDEPTSALDPNGTRRVEDTIKNLVAKTNITVVMVSHSIDQVARMCDTVYLLVSGRVAAQCAGDEVYKCPEPIMQQFVSGQLAGTT